MRWTEDVRTDPESVRKYIDSWTYFYFIKSGHNPKAVEEYQPNNKGEAFAALFDHIYNNLSILDRKALCLTISCSFFSASLLAILPGMQERTGSILLTSVIYLSLMGSLFALVLSLSVVLVHWSTSDELVRPDLDSLVRHVVLIRNLRTFRYRIAWLMHVSVIGISLILVMFHFFSNAIIQFAK